ncbi:MULTISPECIES: LytTR family DNA-binding domain-containing protein [unclassified Aureispira]|uniref:LytR/AlgR family response regulator transcription factor n=1 Tax=unclassified Aureispira TaxID=2649989 RepID=UPI0006961EC6|nr:MULTISPECIES: LytTR family DNA-binding domain-containing protein [unclassified Aureispira]WMX17270.1 LytTR family DNA-binding domain-containing protein [Aureispira sp. CCB-E]
MTIKCLIVDDEQLAREMLQAYISKVPELELVALCKSAHEAQEVLERQHIDLIFLDIQMPQQSGIDFLRHLGENKPSVIFTTAYPNYAVQGFELAAVDYLLKPIAFDRFAQAIQKIVTTLDLSHKANLFEQQQERQEQFIMVHSEHKHHKIFLKDIIYIESLKEYVRYHTTQGKIIELNSMKRLEADLPDHQFIRIHRSYIVALPQIQSYQNGNIILKLPLELPIGKTYKKTILEKLFK